MTENIKRILVTGAGGTPSTNFVRSLRDSPEKFYIIGGDVNKYYLCRSETDEKYLLPQANDKRYIDVLCDLIDRTKSEFIYSQPDPEIFVISKNRDILKKHGARTFLPDHKTIEICQNKYLSYKKWKYNNIQVPETLKIDNMRDLENAFEILNIDNNNSKKQDKDNKTKTNPIWIRNIISPGAGKGSLKVDNLEMAKAWIDFCDNDNNGWGNFTASEYLSDKTVTWMSLWKDGELIVAQGRKRLYWELGNRSPSGVTGLTGAGVTVSDSIVDIIVQDAIFAIDKKPNGIFSVDMTYDSRGTPNPTEINIGRFFTTHYFFSKAGINFPYIFIKLAYDEEIPDEMIKKKINPLPEGLLWIRGMDFLPILTNVNEVEKYENEFNERTKNL